MIQMFKMIRAFRTTCCAATLLAAIVALSLPGCESGLERIDRRVESLLLESNQAVGDPVAPRVDYQDAEAKAWSAEGVYTDPLDEHPATTNPPAPALTFNPAAERDAETVIARLDGYGVIPDDAERLNLADALQYSMQNAREFQFAEEEYVLTVLRLISERHLWGPRFFNDMSALVTGDGNDGNFDTALRVVNDFRVTQRLPYGGDVSARVLAQATEDLHRRVAGENTQSADIILAADVPLLRGAGSIAREGRIQAERDVIYAARTFARFRRDFLFQITRDYLDLVVIQRRIANAEQNVDSFEQVEARQRALFDAGRSTPFDLGQAENETLDAVDRLDSSREDYRVALDQFKSRIGFPIEEPLVIEPDSLGLPTPLVSLDDAVRAAMGFRLDLQTQRDTLDDSQREVDNARNLLLGDLRLVGSVTIPTDPDKNRGGVDFEPGDAEFEAGITYGLPLDRELERVNLREAQIGLERSRRAYERVRDNIAIQVRAAVRGIDSAQFSFEIQEANVAIALQREASIKADPARATIRDKTEAINQTVSAKDARDRARRDLEVAILFYLLESGQLRVDGEGYLEPLAGMEVAAGNGVTGGMNGIAAP